MHARVQKWGNSLALRIPRPFANEAGLGVNSQVDVCLENGSLVVRLIKKLSLEDLLEKVTPDNLHGEVDFGSAVGKEAW